MFGNIKEAYLLHISHGFSTMVFNIKGWNPLEEHNEVTVMIYTCVIGESPVNNSVVNTIL